MTLLSLSILSSTQAETNVKCLDVIKAADKAIADKDKVIKDLNHEIDTLTVQNDKDKSQLLKDEQYLKRWYIKPTLTIPIGATVALGIVLNPLFFIAAGALALGGILGL